MANKKKQTKIKQLEKRVGALEKLIKQQQSRNNILTRLVTDMTKESPDSSTSEFVFDLTKKV